MLRKGEYHPDQYEDYLANGYRFNMVVNILDVGFYFFALNVVSAAVVLPVFMLRLGASAFLVALLPSIQVVGMRLPQILVPFFVEGRTRQKPYVLAFGVAQRLPWLVMVPLILWLAESQPGWLLAAFMLCYLACNIALGFSHPAWSDFIAKAIPDRRRGLFMGLNMMTGYGLGIVGGLIVAYIMKSGRFEYPVNYAAVFLVASVLFWMSFGVFALSREPIVLASRSFDTVRSYMRSLLDVLRDDHPFRRYLVFLTLFYSIVMGTGLFMVHGVEAFGVTDKQSGDFVVASAVAVLVSSPLVGMIGDRFGHRLVLALSGLLYVAACALAILASHWTALYAVFIVSAMSLTAWIISMRNFVYQLAPADRRPTYVGLSSTLPAPFVVLYSLGAGWLAEAYGCVVPFAVSSVICAAAVGVLFTVKVRTERR